MAAGASRLFSSASGVPVDRGVRLFSRHRGWLLDRPTHRERTLRWLELSLAFFGRPDCAIDRLAAHCMGTAPPLRADFRLLQPLHLSVPRLQRTQECGFDLLARDSL